MPAHLVVLSWGSPSHFTSLDWWNIARSSHPPESCLEPLLLRVPMDLNTFLLQQLSLWVVLVYLPVYHPHQTQLLEVRGSVLVKIHQMVEWLSNEWSTNARQAKYIALFWQISVLSKPHFKGFSKLGCMLCTLWLCQCCPNWLDQLPIQTLTSTGSDLDCGCPIWSSHPVLVWFSGRHTVTDTQ